MNQPTVPGLPREGANPKIQAFISFANETEQPIDVEILETTEGGTGVDLVYHSLSWEVEENPDNIVPAWITTGLILLSTPWGIGSLSLLLLANLLISGVQLWRTRGLIIAQPPSENPTPIASSPQPPVSHQFNLTSNPSKSIIIGSLSTFSSQSVINKSSEIPVAFSPNPKAITPDKNNPPPRTVSLANALLPPSLQPQVPPSYEIAPIAVQVPPPPPMMPVPEAYSPPSPPSVPADSPVVSSPVQPTQIEPSPPPLNDTEVSKDEQVRQMMQQQILMEEGNNGDTPLGFTQKTRLELQNGVNQVPPTQLPQQVNQLQQLQQRQVLDSVQ